MLTWADASGVDCIIAAVIYLKTQDRWYHCYMKVPDHIMSQFLAREDHEIQGQELLGVILAYYSFRHWVAGTYWTIFCDNSSVLNMVLGGAAGASAGDLNTIVGKLWLQLVVDDTRLPECHQRQTSQMDPPEISSSSSATRRAHWWQQCFHHGWMTFRLSSELQRRGQVRDTEPMRRKITFEQLCRKVVVWQLGLKWSLSAFANISALGVRTKSCT